MVAVALANSRCGCCFSDAEKLWELPKKNDAVNFFRGTQNCLEDGTRLVHFVVGCMRGKVAIGGILIEAIVGPWQHRGVDQQKQSLFLFIGCS